MIEGAPLVKFVYFVFTCMPGKSYRRRFQSLLLCLCDLFATLFVGLNKVLFIQETQKQYAYVSVTYR